MLALLVLLFVVIPFAELYVIIQVSHVFGVVDTLGLDPASWVRLRADLVAGARDELGLAARLVELEASDA